MAFVELLALYLAGLSFFFTGVAGISENLRLMSGQRFRLLLSRATNHPVLAGLLGLVMGAITQSAPVVAFILKGMVASGMLTLRRAIVVLACANVGTALLVFAAAIDFHLPVLFLIGATGLIIASKLWGHFRPAFAALLSVGLLMFGLEMMKQAFKPFSSSSSAADVTRFLNFRPDAAFFASTLMRSVVHSSSAVAAIGVTVNKGGMINDFPIALGIAGLGVGSAIAGYIFSRRLVGVPRQISLHQGITNLCAGLLMAAMLFLERLTHIPLLLALIRRITPAGLSHIPITYLLFNLAILGCAVVTLPWAPAWLARVAPPTPEEDLSQPQYLQHEALESPETALDLVALEQMRVLRALELYLRSARGDVSIKLPELHQAAAQLSGEIDAFLESLIRRSIPTSLAARVIAFQRKEETLSSLEENVFTFANALDETHTAAAPMVEALDTIVLTAADALQSRDPTDLDLLIRLTDDRGAMMERLRSRISLDQSQSVAGVATLHYATTLFERNVWLLRQLALWLREDTRLNSPAKLLS